MKNFFLPYELAVLFKHNGFDEDCIAFYTNRYTFGLERPVAFPQHQGSAVRGDKNSSFKEWNPEFIYTTALTYQQATDWFREKNQTIIEVAFYNNGEDWEDIRYICKVSEFKHMRTHDSFVKDEFKTYHEALNKAIEEAFKLI